jgi:hypothetical protein
MEVQLHAFLTSVLNGNKWLVSRPVCFTRRKRALDIHWMGGWVCPRAGLDVMAKRKVSSPCRDSNLEFFLEISGNRRNTELRYKPTHSRYARQTISDSQGRS